ncbi:MAG: hypothetical protein WCF57_02460 [Pyrinomonadaceae bacterium]
MASIDFQVTTYTYSIYTQADNNLIWDGKHLKVRGMVIGEGGGFKVVIYLLSDESYLPANRYQEDTKRVFIFGRHPQFQWYVDMLRNEKPVFCHARTDLPGWFNLSTNAEPVGEQEG